MTDYDGIVLSGADSPGNELRNCRGLGPYRLRTVMARRGYRIKMIDFCESYSTEELVRLVRRYVGPGTRFLGVSTTYMAPKQLLKLLQPVVLRAANEAAGSRLQVISGGARVLRYPHPAIDWYVSGYADEAFPALVDFLTGKSMRIKFTNLDGKKHIDSNHDYPVKDTSDLTTVWLPEDVIRSYETLPIEIARGCIFRCSFCAYPLNGKKKFDYIRDPENLLAEIRRNREQFGVLHYGFMDDTYNDSEFKMDLMHKALTSLDFKIRFSCYIKPELLKTWPHHTEKLAESGLMGATMGFESFHYKARQAVRKGPDVEGILKTVEKLHHDSQNRVGIDGGFIAGLPHETLESLYATQKWLKENTHLIQTVTWNRLIISQKITGSYMSDIDKNPESFGYQIYPEAGSTFVRWRNGALTSELTEYLKNHFSNEMDEIRKWGGWNTSSLSHIPGLNIPELVRTRATIRDSVDFQFVQESRAQYVRNYFDTQISGNLNQPDFNPYPSTQP